MCEVQEFQAEFCSHWFTSTLYTIFHSSNINCRKMQIVSKQRDKDLRDMFGIEKLYNSPQF